MEFHRDWLITRSQALRSVRRCGQCSMNQTIKREMTCSLPTRPTSIIWGLRGHFGIIFPILTIDSYRSLMSAQLPGLPSERHGCTCRPRNAVQVAGNQDPVPASWVMHSHSSSFFDSFGSYSASFRMKDH